ncbi:Glutaminyl-peptide cyclotransferase [Halotydeus destructor]|nr:Glutaminyl-peptide cyclotransferase [Halotydeus destructor]
MQPSFSSLIFTLVTQLLTRLFTFTDSQASAVSWNPNEEWIRAPKAFNDNELLALATPTAAHHDYFNETLDHILVTRVPGTSGHRKVNKFIVSTMRDLGWQVEEDEFSANTPHGSKPFRNIMATLNGNACKRLVFACHYDSKYSRGNKFLGATDSAVPCAMMIYLARALDGPLKDHANTVRDTTLQFIFFDGEEAFEQWTSTDSIYGSRHLADKWNKTPFPANDQQRSQCPGDYVSELDRIEAFVLLDLLGAPNPNFFSFFPETSALYARLIRLERRLNGLKALEAHKPETETSYFNNRRSFGGIEDDHIPFMRKGVKILHIIPSPFPSVWHKDSDNKQNLDHQSINNLNSIFKAFIVEYMHLDMSRLG